MLVEFCSVPENHAITSISRFSFEIWFCTLGGFDLFSNLFSAISWYPPHVPGPGLWLCHPSLHYQLGDDVPAYATTCQAPALSPANKYSCQSGSTSPREAPQTSIHPRNDQGFMAVQSDWKEELHWADSDQSIQQTPPSPCRLWWRPPSENLWQWPLWQTRHGGQVPH